MKSGLTCILLMIVFVEINGNCKYFKIESIGCYKDWKYSRVFSTMMFTDRDSSSRVYSKNETDWGNYKFYLPGLVRRCGRAAIEHGFTLFGIQYYGECWGGAHLSNFPENGAKVAKGCFNRYYGSCDNTLEYCAGGAFYNYVYLVKLNA